MKDISGFYAAFWVLRALFFVRTEVPHIICDFWLFDSIHQSHNNGKNAMSVLLLSQHRIPRDMPRAKQF